MFSRVSIACCWLTCLLGGLGLFAHTTQAAAAKAADVEFFEKNVRPVLVAECYECHSAKEQKGGLRLDYRDGLLKGGKSGPAIIPGNPDKSRLIIAVKHTDADLKMPKKGAKLDDATIADLVEWVKRGAPDPRDEPPKEKIATSWEDIYALRSKWWSYQPLKQPGLPAVKDVRWSSQPVDRFILAKLEEQGLKPSAQADKRTLIRRVNFTLTGLPPTPEEVNDFLADTSPQAFAKVVDRLLASPAFGECWARHWMDLVRYAETHGSEGDPAIREAWRYRDYLIRAFNIDVPIDQLIREHIAGDLLPHPRINQAEGIDESMLGIASFCLNEHGFQPVDTLDEQVRTIDNQIDVLTKAFQGLTVTCARCHDHKFDPISQKDYYALFGVLGSVRPAQVRIDAPELLTRDKAELQSLKQQIKPALAEAWLKWVAEELPKRVHEYEASSTGKTVQDIQKLERDALQMETAARDKVLQQRGKEEKGSHLPKPIARWAFDGDAKDAEGFLDGELRGGASIRNGRLILNGTDAFMETKPLGRELREKTLEAWVALGNLQQGGGGVMTVESIGGRVFDSIVFAEKESRHWVPGSDNFHRSQNLGGPAETAKPDELVHVAITYAADGHITFYRNGQLYGSSYSLTDRKTTQAAFPAGTSHVLIGRRHTGGGRAFLKGEIEEGRLYDRALTAKELAESFAAGPGGVSKQELLAAMSTDEKAAYEKVLGELADLRRHKKQLELHDAPLKEALTDADKNEENPLHAWVKFGGLRGDELKKAWSDWLEHEQAESKSRQAYNAGRFNIPWDMTKGDDVQWFRNGQNLSPQATKPGEFALAVEGDKLVTGLYPSGVYSHLLSQKHGALFTSPRFKIETDNIYVKAAGGEGAMVRLMVDNYPLGLNPIFPKANIERDEPGWVHLDTAYRKGSWAYLEFGTYEELTRPIAAKGQPAPKDGRSWFGVEKVLFNDKREVPKDEVLPTLALAGIPVPAERAGILHAYQQALTAAINAWRQDSLTETQRELMSFFLKSGLLPNELDELNHPVQLTSLIAAYRQKEADVPVARRAPGVIEAKGFDAPLLPRGDYLRPGATVPRGYLKIVEHAPVVQQNGKTFMLTHTPKDGLSGRLQLAESITSPNNPLTARVMVNRIWHHLFGRGIVSTVDNFGRVGAQPTHPELLDYLALKLMQQGWSTKEMVRYLVLTKTWQQSSEPNEAAEQLDAANDLLSHFRVQRLEAEPVRDALLAVSDQLDRKQFGPPVDIKDKTRRSIYMTVRRTALSPFLEVFDAPKPFTTLGRRDTTNVPAQSLTLLNDPFVIGLAKDWASVLLKEIDTEEVRIRKMFEKAYARPPKTEELQACEGYLAQLMRDQKVSPEQGMLSEAVWQDFAQSLFNLKEFIYVR